MALQTQNLVMVGLGILGDAPPNRVQHQLMNGIHLRWAFKRELGFPWHGYYLFRRRYRPGIINCLSKVTGNLPVSLWPGNIVNTPFGQISSDQSLRLTDDFPPGGLSELDLDGRHYLRFSFSPGEPVRRIEAQIGFRAEARVEVTALLGNVPVATDVVWGRINDLQTVELEFDAITAVEFATGPAALIDLCFVPVSQDADQGWELVPDFPYPFCLPVTHPDYPASGGLPVDQAAAEASAMSRVMYGPSAAWGGAPFHELHDRLLELVAGGPAATQMAQRRFPVVGVPVPPDPGIRVPTMPEQYPLDLVLIGSLHPAIAQMVGLYWVDQKVEPDASYDYLILADHEGRLRGDPDAVLALLLETGFLDVDGYIVFNKKKAPAPPFAAPKDVRAYALPGAVMRTQGGGIKDATNNVGLRWDRGVSDIGGAQVLLPGRPVMYHLWRADLEDNEPAAAPPSDECKLLTEREPILIAKPRLPPGKTPQRPPNWPPFPLHTIDTGLKEGWYSYEVNGVDIFGRHSPNSDPATWYQWVPIPEPEPPPWYYQNPKVPADAVVHAFAVRLLDKVPPPPPTAIEAYALDPADPTVAKDAAYNTWWAALTAVPWYQALSEAQKKDLIGLRVRWQWPEAHMRQARDTREFRIYYHSGQMNALVGRITQVVPAGAKETVVDMDIANVHPADTFVDCWLRIGTKAFKILESHAGSPLRLRVKNIGPEGKDPPRANTPCTLVLPPDNRKLATDFSLATNWQERLYVVGYNERSALALVGRTTQVTPASTTETDVDTDIPNAHPADTFVGCWLRIGANDFKILSSQDISPLRLRVENAGPSNSIAPSANTPCTLILPPDHKLAIDFSLASDAGGRWLRQYELFLPDPGSPFHNGLPLTTSLAEPIVYAHIGVSAADDKTHTTDAPQWAAGQWGGRFGNEGPVGPPVKVFRVRREAPPPPAQPPDSDKVYASKADYHNHSFYTYRWKPAVDPQNPQKILPLRCHIFRALDDTLFKTDWTWRSQNKALLLDPNDPNHKKLFPPAWEENKHRPVADELQGFVLAGAAATVADALVTLDGVPDLTKVKAGRDFLWLKEDTESQSKCYPIIGVDTNAHSVTVNSKPKLSASASEWAIPLYQLLSNDAQRVLAGLPGNDRAFAQLTIQPLDPQEPDPDDPGLLRWCNRVGPDNPPDFVVDLALRIYIDTLDGRSTNRYFYRSVYVDGANNRSDLSLSSPPVWLPNVVPPRTPVITKVLGGDRQITLTWASNREPELAEYRVYRAESKKATLDLRLMTLAHTEPVPSGDPAARPTEVTWTDTPVLGLIDLYYRLVAVDDAENVSRPSPTVIARAYDQSPPKPATWHMTKWVKFDENGNSHPWSDEVANYKPAVALEWSINQAGVKCLVQRMRQDEMIWMSASPWLTPTQHDKEVQIWSWLFYDRMVIEGEDYFYRVMLVNASGSTTFSAQIVAREG